MPTRPIVLIHGYSDQGESYARWRELLLSDRFGYRPEQVRICSYRSLVNEITVRDIAEGFDRALRLSAGIPADQDFDAMVHSTGMLVIRAWLARYEQQRGRLKHLIAIAPATFGSPLAHKGRSFIGSVLKGSRDPFRPDFLEAGDAVLDALELGSRFTWDLAHEDMIDRQIYGPTRSTPYVFVFCGNEGYGGLRGLINEPGTDGTVRWAGCALDTRKITIDFRVDADRPAGEPRVQVSGMQNLSFPLVPVQGLNHSSILHEPNDALAELVAGALQVNSAATYDAWLQLAADRSRAARATMDNWQQFVVRAVDERGDPITDWDMQLLAPKKGAQPEEARMEQFSLDVHAYQRDKSFRCFHVNLDKLGKDRANRWLEVRLMASCGTRYVIYQGVNGEGGDDDRWDEFGQWSAKARLAELTDKDGKPVWLFYPLATTLVEIVLNREPWPTEPDRPNEVTWWIEPK